MKLLKTLLIWKADKNTKKLKKKKKKPENLCFSKKRPRIEKD